MIRHDLYQPNLNAGFGDVHIDQYEFVPTSTIKLSETFVMILRQYRFVFGHGRFIDQTCTFSQGGLVLFRLRVLPFPDTRTYAPSCAFCGVIGRVYISTLLNLSKGEKYRTTSPMATIMRVEYRFIHPTFRYFNYDSFKHLSSPTNRNHGPRKVALVVYVEEKVCPFWVV